MNRVPLTAVLLVTLFAVAACSGGNAGDQDGSGSCPAELVLDGREYQQSPTDGPPRRGDRVGSAEFTSCHTQADPDFGKRLPAWEVEGVPATKAFVVEMGGDPELYISKDVSSPCSIPVAKC